MLDLLARSIEEVEATEALAATLRRLNKEQIWWGKSVNEPINILILDDIIAQLEENIRSSPVYQYRLKRAKQLLFPQEQSDKKATY